MWDENQRRRYIAKVVKAQIYEYLNRLWNGSRAVGTLSSAAITGIAVASIGPNCRLGLGLIQLTVVGIVKTLAWQAPGDSNVGASSVDLNVVPAGTAVTLVSEDGTAEVRLTVNGPALNVASAEVGITIQTITNQFEGLRRLLPAGQLCDPTGVDGSVLSLDFLRQAEDLNNGPKETLAWCCTRAGLRQFKKIRDAAHVTPEEIDIGYGRGVRPAFDSIPFFVCDQLPDNLTKGIGTALTEFWLVSFGQPDGSVETAPYTSDGVVGLYSGNSSTEESVIQSMPDDPTVPMQWMGFWRDEEMGKVTGFDRFEEQVGADVGVALYCQSAISCLRFIRTT
jgi:hypothetical protein